MKIPRSHIASLVADHTLKKGVSKDYARQVAAYLLSQRRTRELDSLTRDIQADWAAAGHVEAVVTVAYPLADKLKKDISQKVSRLYPHAKKINISETRDPAVIGGVRLNLPGSQLDLSLQTKLNELKQLALGGRI